MPEPPARGFLRPFQGRFRGEGLPVVPPVAGSTTGYGAGQAFGLALITEFLTFQVYPRNIDLQGRGYRQLKPEGALP